jgi:putative tryptophan/tyrosine transport system substrate-binding protein
VVILGVGDPVGQGLVASLARPGRNITGLSAAVTEIYPKRVQLLRELVPRAARIAALINMGNPALPPQWKEIEMAARSLGIEPHLLDVRTPGGPGAGLRCRDQAPCRRAHRRARYPHAGQSAKHR